MFEPTIKILDEQLINKIAAGEVVERPASVVKELVENSLDAGAKSITVKIQDGGRKLIQVLDDGCGIAPQELKLALARHATSKISEFDDLYALHTNGFRGEALASIASVSQLELASQRAGYEPREIVAHAGQIVDERAVAMPQGTRVTVKYLFYQTPARLKFLRTPETETAHIVDALSQLALSHPEVAFALIQNDRKLLDAPKTQNARERVVAILGADLADWMYPIHAEANGFLLEGFFAHPQVAKSQRKGVFLFVNGRAVNDRVLWHAVQEGYRDLLMKGKYPVVVLHLNLPARDLDVNVHPQKSEIRFHHPQEVHAFVKQALRQHLQASPWNQNQNDAHDEASVASDFVSSSPNLTTQDVSPIVKTLHNWGQRHFAAFGEAAQIRPVSRVSSTAFKNETATPVFEQKQIQFGRTPYAEMQPIGQVWGTYILCEAQGKLILIDQHAAHERVGFEKLLIEQNERGIQSQPLLVPETFDLKPSDADILKNYLTQLSAYGFEVEFFGGNTFALKAVPVLFKDKLPFLNFIGNIIDDLRETGEMVSLKDKNHHLLATMACHAQIRAHHHLSREEITVLLQELDDYQFTDFCPHGRPVSVEITVEEVEKWFRRVL